ncbi:hypothetical protein A5875_003405 [Enterococcus sp. 3H8_DIV0648]|nr:hypothetical protein A5875_003405 [Enterococcus sp. 3H8_DIV0648]
MRKMSNKNMKNNQLKILVLDLDGTLLNEQKVLDDRTAKAVFMAHNLFDHIVIASGRGHDSIEGFFKQIGIHGYKVAQNGAYAMNPKNELMYFYQLSKELVEESFNFAFKNQLSIFLTGIEDRLYYHPNLKNNSYGISTVAEFETIMNTQNLSFCKFSLDVSHLPTHEINQLKEQLVALNLNVALSDQRHFEMTEKGVSKLSGVKKIVDTLGYSLAEVMAIGDSENDLDLISSVGYGIAMENAIPELKETADLVIGTNDQLGVAEFLQSYLRKESK